MLNKLLISDLASSVYVLHQVSLLDMMPAGNVRDLTRILEDYGRNKK